MKSNSSILSIRTLYIGVALIVSGLLVVLLNATSKLHGQCEMYLGYSLDSFDEVSRFVKNNMVSSERYLAVKKLSLYSYELNILTINEKQGKFISVSYGGFLVKNLEKQVALQVYGDLVGKGDIYLKDNIMGSTIHGECAFVRVQNKRRQDSIVIDAQFFEWVKNDIINELDIYYGIEETRKKYFPRVTDLPIEYFTWKDLLAAVDKAEAENEYVKVDASQVNEATEEEVEDYRKAIRSDYFFELK